MGLTPEQKRRISEFEKKRSLGDTDLLPEGYLPQETITKIREKVVKALIWVAVLTGACLALGFVILEYDLEQVPIRHWLKTPDNVRFPRSVVQVFKTQRTKVRLLEGGHGSFLSHNYSEAVGYARKVLAIDSENERARNLVDASVDALLREADEESRQRRFEEAFERATLARQFKPEDAETQAMLSRIADALTLEAEEDYENQRYEEVVRKGWMVLEVRANDRKIKTLFRFTATAFLDIADAYYLRGRYAEALLKAQAATEIAPQNRRAERLIKQITKDLDEPPLELQGITKEGGDLYAIIYVPKSGKTHFKKPGEVFRNFKIISIDERLQQVTVMQIKTQNIITLKPKSKRF